MICDLAEYYGIYEYENMPPLKVAIFCIGLRENSRVKRKYQQMEHDMNTLLLAKISDLLSLLWWAKTKDGQKNKNRPTMISELLISDNKKETDNISFNSGEEFMKKREELINKIKKGGE